MSEKTAYIADTGYTKICVICDLRHGVAKPGVRTLALELCAKCHGKSTQQHLHSVLYGIRTNSINYRKRGGHSGKVASKKVRKNDA